MKSDNGQKRSFQQQHVHPGEINGWNLQITYLERNLFHDVPFLIWGLLENLQINLGSN